MNPLSTRLDEYLSLRRRLGFKMCQAGYLLPQFVRFAQQEKAAFITTKLALAWATQDKVSTAAGMWMKTAGVKIRSG